MTTQAEEREDYWYAPGLDERLTVILNVEVSGPNMLSLEAHALQRLREFVGDDKPVVSKIERGAARPEFESMVGTARRPAVFEQQWTFWIYAPMKGVAEPLVFARGVDS